MKLLEVYVPEIEVYVRFKRMDHKDVMEFVEEHSGLSRDEYVLKVLETIIFNLRSEVSEVLKVLSKDKARVILTSLYNGCVMLNPGLDVDEWLNISSFASVQRDNQNNELPPPQDEIPPPAPEPKPKKKTPPKQKKISKPKFLGLEKYLTDNIIDQNEAITSVVGALKRSVAGLGDELRPLGVFLFAGASGVGKTELAKKLHSYLYGEEFDLVRIDCGEFQHKHENQKLIGSPPGYVGHDEGGYLTNQIKKNSHTVVLLDEVEKAHPDMWNTFLRVFDEGMITDGSGREYSFRNAIIVMTTNLGNRETVRSILDGGVGFGGNVDIDVKNAQAPPRKAVVKHTEKAIRKHFRPELLNRIDKIVVFNHLTRDGLNSIAELELAKMEEKLSKRGISVSYDDKVLEQMISEGVNPVEGARGLSRIRRDLIEDVVSDALLSGSRWPRGTVVTITYSDGEYLVTTKRPARKKKKEASNE